MITMVSRARIALSCCLRPFQISFYRLSLQQANATPPKRVFSYALTQAQADMHKKQIYPHAILLLHVDMETILGGCRSLLLCVCVAHSCFAFSSRKFSPFYLDDFYRHPTAAVASTKPLSKIAATLSKKCESQEFVCRIFSHVLLLKSKKNFFLHSPHRLHPLSAPLAGSFISRL